LETNSDRTKPPDANPVRYEPSQKYFARLRVKGKLIRRRLKQGAQVSSVCKPGWCQQKNGCALTALDGNGGGKPRALPWAVRLRPFRPALRGVILDEESHGFSVDGSAQVLRYKDLCRFAGFTMK